MLERSREPIFLVGAPRSGTTLLAALLGGHSRIAAGPETQFFNKIGERELAAAIGDPRWPERAVSSICGLTLAGQPVSELFGMNAGSLRADLSRRLPSAASMLESLTATTASRSGKPRWLEKTPNHLLHLDRIRREWPDATVIRIVRDPRDSAASMTRLPWASDSVVANGLLWSQWHEASADFFRTDRRAFTVKFEDLVEDPKRELRALCERLGEGFEEDMLDTHKTATAVSSRAEVWKSEVSKPIDRERGARWKTTLSADTARCVALLCGRGIEEFGYERPAVVGTALKVFQLDRQAIERNEGLLLELARHGLRLEPSRDPLREGRLAVFGRSGGGKRATRKLTLVVARRLRRLETVRVEGLLAGSR